MGIIKGLEGEDVMVKYIIFHFLIICRTIEMLVSKYQNIVFF